MSNGNDNANDINEDTYPTNTAFTKAQLARQEKEKAFINLVRDALKSPRLTEWETRFVSSMQFMLTNGHIVSLDDCTARQAKVWAEIEEKIYAAG